MFQNNLLMAAAANASGGGASVVSIGNSALFAGSGQLSFTPSGTETNGKKYTHSMWISRTHLTNTNSSGYNDNIYSSYTVGGWPSQVLWNVNDCFSASNISSTTYQGNKITTAKYRDLTGAWYHIFIVFDSTLTVGDDRFQIYINGERVTSFSTDTDPAADSTSSVGKGSVNQLYGLYYNSLRAFYGYLSELYFVDGTALDVTDFGEYDSSGLFWTPKDPTAIAESISSYGNNGWYLNFSNGSDLGEDFSGNNNDFSVTSLTQSTHTPTNIKPLLNPLNSSANTSLSNGNQTFSNTAANNIAFGTIPLPSTGKWYFEYKLNNASSASIVHVIGLMKLGNPAGWTSGLSSGFSDFSSCYLAAAQQIWQDGSLLNSPSTGAGSINDILSLAVDLDNTKMWIGYNNSFYNASGGTDGNPATGANAMSTKNFSDNYGIIVGLYSSQGTIQFDTADFTYTPPSGYLALNSTNLTSETTRTASDTTKYFETILYEGNGSQQRVGQFQPFGDLFTVAKSGLWSASSADLTRGSMSGTGTTWTFSAWVKRTEPAVGSATANFVFTTASDAGLAFGGAGTADEVAWYSGSYTGATNSDLVTDQSQWYHVVVKNNGGTGTIYLNGNEVLGSVTVNTADATMAIGSYNGSSNEFDGYISEVVFIDGSALAPTSFAKTDTSTNRWVPIDVSGLTYNGNSFYLNFADSSDLGNDVSGNNKDFTNNSGVLSSTDSPTTNFAVLDANQTTWGSAVTTSVGNLTAEGTTTTLTNNITSTLTMYSGKYVYAFKPDSVLNLEGQAGIVNDACYIARSNNLQETTVGTWSAEFNGVASQFSINQNGTRSTVTPNSNYETGDYIIVALDVDNLLVWLGHYDASTDTTKWYNSVAVDWTGNPATGTGGSPIYGNWFKFSVALYSGRGGVADFGQNSLLSNIDIPTGFNYLTQDNIASSDQFITALSWIKNRDATDWHMLENRVTGAGTALFPNDASAASTQADFIHRFLAGGVQIGEDAYYNTANESYAFWNFMMEATGSGSSLTSGSINTTALVDTTLGMSVGTFTGTGSANETIQTGLTGCEMIIVKRTNASYGWAVWHSGLTDDYSLLLNTTAAQVSSGYWDTSGNTSTLIELGTDSEAVNKSGQPYNFIAFAPSQFISIGTYEGNASSTDGAFVPTVNSLGIPIQPVWIIAKNIDATASWTLWDTARNPYNVGSKYLHPDTTAAEQTADAIDIDTGGFKWRNSNVLVNASNTYVYMAIGTPIIDTDGRIIAGR